MNARIFHKLPKHTFFLMQLFLFFFSVNCFSPKKPTSNLAMVTFKIQKEEPLLNEFVKTKFDSLLIEDGKTSYNFSENEGYVYFFQNIPSGEYMILDAVHSLDNGGSASQAPGGNTRRLDQLTIDFSDELREISRTKIGSGELAFMGEFTAKIKIAIQDDPAITITGEKTQEGEIFALDVLARNLARSSDWGERAREKLKVYQRMGIYKP